MTPKPFYPIREVLVCYNKINPTPLYSGVGVASVLTRLASRGFAVVADVRPPFLREHGLKVWKTTPLSIQVSTDQLRTWRQLLELHPDDGQDIVGPLRLFGSLDASRPAVHVRTYQRLACDVDTNNFAPTCFLGVLVVVGGARDLVEVEALHSDDCNSGGGFAVLRVERTSNGFCCCTPWLLFRRRPAGLL